MISDAKQILGFAKIPSTVLGSERVNYIADHIHELQVEQRLQYYN